jgi:UDP-3-O-[3-hydroxymyristoyl] glucosamine N-acyltransferase
VTFVDSAKRLAEAEATQAAAILVPLEVTSSSKPIIRTASPRLAFAQALEAFAPPAARRIGIHPTAVIGADCDFGAGVSIGPYAVIGDCARLGAGVEVGALTSLGDDVVLGDGTRVHPGAVIYSRVTVGARVIIHAGAVIGSDGFGYIREQGALYKVPQIGTVVIEDDVEIGANVAIDRATTGATLVGRGTKIDNLVQIAHNTRIGQDCIVVAQVGISGSCRLGDRVVLAGQVGLVDHVAVGDDASVCAQAGVTSDIPAGTRVSGMPARPHRDQMKLQAALQRLPRLLTEVRDLQRQVAELQAELERRSGTR